MRFFDDQCDDLAKDRLCQKKIVPTFNSVLKFFLGGILKFRMDLEDFRKGDVFVVIQSQCSCPIQSTW